MKFYTANVNNMGSHTVALNVSCPCTKISDIMKCYIANVNNMGSHIVTLNMTCPCIEMSA